MPLRISVGELTCSSARQDVPSSASWSGSNADRLALEGREGDDPVEVALELADEDLIFREEECDVVVELDLVRLGLLPEDRDLRLEVGGLDVDERPPSKRLFRRSVRPGISRGGTSDEKTIWLPRRRGR